jgi:hypothetical protein
MKLFFIIGCFFEIVSKIHKNFTPLQEIKLKKFLENLLSYVYPCSNALFGVVLNPLMSGCQLKKYSTAFDNYTIMKAPNS